MMSLFNYEKINENDTSLNTEKRIPILNNNKKKKHINYKINISFIIYKDS